MRLIDADALNVRLSTLDRLARSDAQAALLGRVFYVVSNQPTVDAEPVRHGRWKYNAAFTVDGDVYYGRYQCDQCNHYIDAGSDRKYCPNCGTDMREGTKDGKAD